MGFQPQRLEGRSPRSIPAVAATARRATSIPLREVRKSGCTGRWARDGNRRGPQEPKISISWQTGAVQFRYFPGRTLAAVRPDLMAPSIVAGKPVAVQSPAKTRLANGVLATGRRRS